MSKRVPTGDPKRRGELKLKLEVKNGAWFGRIYESDKGVEVWTHLGAVESLTPAKAADCAKLCRWYYQAGILHEISSFIVRQTATDPIDMIVKRDGRLEYSRDCKTFEPFDDAAIARYKETI